MLFLALLLLCPRCKYLTAGTGSRLAGCWGHMLILAEGFHTNCSVAVSLHCQRITLSPAVVSSLVHGQDKGISMISGEKGPSFTAGCHFPLPNTQRKLPTGAQLLSLAANSLWVEQNHKKRRNTNFPFTLCTLTQSNIRGAIFLEDRKNLPFPGHRSVTEEAAEISC